jgi:hypothetical protein
MEQIDRTVQDRIQRQTELDLWEDQLGGRILSDYLAGGHYRQRLGHPQDPTSKAGWFSDHPEAKLRKGHTSMRFRIGRGGRGYLDRIVEFSPTSIPQNCSAEKAERFRYDSDLSSTFPLSNTPSVFDDYEFTFSSNRLSYFRQFDRHAIMADSAHLDKHLRYLTKLKDSDKPDYETMNRLRYCA